MIKKAQVSIFIILGIVILAAAAVVFYINTTAEEEEIEPGVFISTKEIPTQLDPVSNFVTQCLDDAAVRGLKLIGEHGGYVDINSPELTKQNFKMSNDPTESDAVAFAPQSDLKIPYWWYLESSNNCQETCKFASKRPPLRDEDNSIEKQLDRYIEKNLPECINNFESLKEQGFEITQSSAIKANTKVAENDVVVVLDYSLEAKKSDTASTIDQFFVRVPVDLQKIYSLSTDIANMQQKYRFLERQTMNLISSFSSVDKDKLPPITDMRFEFGSTTSWRKSDVKNSVTQVLASYIPFFQVDGAKNFNRGFYSSGLKQRLYDSMIIPVADQEYNNLDVTFNYLDFWPAYFNINCNGDICQPESASSNLLAFIGLQRYDFAYDISFPALVEVFDENALNGRGYKFNFFLEANVRNNQELESEFVPLQAANVPTASFLCNIENRNSADVTIKAIDAVEAKPLEDVSVTLSVAGESCYIGSTNEDGTLVAKFPTGTAGAVVGLLKPDYISKSQLFDASPDRKLSVEAKLDPVKDKKIAVKKKLLEKTNRGWEFTNKISDLKPEEEAFVTLTRLSPATEEDFDAVASIKGTNEEQIRLAPGRYEVNINTFLREDIRIPEKKVKKKTGLFSEEEFTIPGIDFNSQNPYPSGGLRMNVTITEDDLKKGTITFFAVSPALENVPEQQRSIDDLNQAAKIEEYSRVFAPLLKPVFQ
ncbi:hypothetical protein HYU50_01900 [Candidatus Woesearchaeota archaeon]|nr:hypothetical protein [Candidatus Woesearchaeota archaeon]